MIVERRLTSATALHARGFPTDRRRRVSLLEVRCDAWVLGSTSSVELERACLADAQQATSPIEVVRRRSGGGAVWLDAVESTWLDVFIPAGDPLWSADVVRSFHWLGTALAEAFTSLGLQAAAGAALPHGLVAAGTGDDGGWCMASVGSGEVTARTPGPSPQLAGSTEPDLTRSTGVVEQQAKKLVGISQRRGTAGSRFSCLWYRRSRSERITQLAGTSAYAGRFAGWADLGFNASKSAVDDAALAAVICHAAAAT